MSTNYNLQDSNLKNLLSPTRAGTFFAPFRSRSANPEGFDSKMKLWICAIEEWAIKNKKLTLSLKDIHQSFISDNGIKPDKECIRLVLSEMKRKSKLVSLTTLKSSKFWHFDNNYPLLDNYIDSKSWLSWSVKKLVFNPASWAISTIAQGNDQTYSDLTDMSITDSMDFVCQKSFVQLSQNLLSELIRISKAEKQSCFEWQHLLELIMPIVETIIDTADSKELSESLDLLIEYLAVNKHVAVQLDNETKLVKIAEETSNDDVIITKKDIAMARLLRAKELLTFDADRYHKQAQIAKSNALGCYNKNEIMKAKSLLRSHKRLTKCAEQKEAQLTNVEIMLDQLENTDSNMMILQAYKDGAEALKVANTKLENNTSILDDMYDVTAEACHLNEEMNQMLKDISCISQGNLNYSNTELERELEMFMNSDGLEDDSKLENGDKTQISSDNRAAHQEIDDLHERLDRLIVCQDLPEELKAQNQSDKKIPMSSKTT